MRDDLMPFREQLREYPKIKELLRTIPVEPCPPVSPPWRIYARPPGVEKYYRRDFTDYRDAYKFLAKKLKAQEFADISITSKRQRFLVPTRIVRITKNGRPVMVKTANGPIQQTKIVPLKPPPGHLWCQYCRRFTIFTYFLTHHAFRGESARMMDPSHRRCCVCGIREVIGASRA